MERSEQSRAIEKLVRDLAPLMPYLADKAVIEVMRNPNQEVWIDSLSEGRKVVGVLETKRATAIIYNVAGLMNRVISSDHPFLEADFPEERGLFGERFNAQMPPVVLGPAFNIRKKARKVFSLDDYVDTGRITQGRAARIKAWIKARKNIVVAGRPNSGKTTVTNALIHEVTRLDPNERLIILEDVPELQCAGRNVLRCLSQPRVPMSRLLLSSLRASPDRILVGELRGVEAYDMLQAWNVGCSGGIGTLHANGVEATLQRIMDLCHQGGQSAPISLMLQTIDAILYVERIGNQGGVISDLALVKGYERGQFIVEKVNEEGELIEQD